MKIYNLNKDYYLREVSIDDAEDLFKICQKDNVTKFLTWNSHQSIEETIHVITNFYLTKTNDNLPNNYAIVDRNTDQVIGIIDFMTGRRTDSVEIGYFLDDLYWGKGITTMALAKLVQIGFEELNLDDLNIYHEIDNTGSKKVIIKNGFKYTGKLVSKIPLKNIEVELLSYKIKKDDYYDKQS